MNPMIAAKGEADMGSLYQRGAVWWMKYYVNGLPVRESTGCARETDARRAGRASANGPL